MKLIRAWTALGAMRLWIALSALTLLRLVVAATLPLTPDEAYYWVWSRALAAGYLDHPPMVALWIRFGTATVGHTAFGIRLLAPAAALLGSVLLHRAAQTLLTDREEADRAVILLNATLLFGAGSVTMTPDTPLLLFWIATLWAMAKLIVTGRPNWWLAVGAACGLALCSKYTAILLPAGILVWLFGARGQRQWLRERAFYGGVAIALLLFLPTLLWNAQHGWASFVKQGGRALVFHPAAILPHLAELAAGQFALATPLILVLCAVGAWRTARTAWRGRQPRITLLAAMIVPAAAIFTEHALGDRVQPNWPAILYPAAAIAAAILTARSAWHRLFWPAVALGAAMTAIVTLQATTGLLPLSRHQDPTLRLAGGYPGLAQDLRTQAARQGAAFVAMDDYGPASLLAALDDACIPVVAIEPRWSLFDLPPPNMDGQTGLLLRSTRRHDAPSTADWTGLTPAGSLTRARNGRQAETYTLYKGTWHTGAEPAAVLPCPPLRAVPLPG